MSIHRHRGPCVEEVHYKEEGDTRIVQWSPWNEQHMHTGPCFNPLHECLSDNNMQAEYTTQRSILKRYLVAGNMSEPFV